MTTTEEGETAERTNKLIAPLRDAEDSALVTVWRSLDTVSVVFPDVNSEDGPRPEITDSSFKNPEQLFGASTQLTERSSRRLPARAGVPIIRRGRWRRH